MIFACGILFIVNKYVCKYRNRLYECRYYCISILYDNPIVNNMNAKTEFYALCDK